MKSRVWEAIELLEFEVGALKKLIKDPASKLNGAVRSASQSKKWLEIRNEAQLSVPASNVRQRRVEALLPIDGLDLRRVLV